MKEASAQIVFKIARVLCAGGCLSAGFVEKIGQGFCARNYRTPSVSYNQS
jgi:hypothetical protein